MTWLQRYRVRFYVRNSIWIFPALGMAAALALVRLLHWIEGEMGWVSDISPETARTVLGTMAASMFTFVVFVSSALLIAVQLASAQLTPRVIAFVFRDPITRWSLTLFVFTFTFCLATLIGIINSVPPLTAYMASYGSAVSLGVFLYLIDHIGHRVRPSGALRSVARLGREVIEKAYPRMLTEPRPALSETTNDWGGKLTRTIGSPWHGVILAFDVEGLVSLARRADCVIELVPQVGDSIAASDPLFRVFGEGASLSADALCQSIALGAERTLEQDPVFAFRILVDIASKGLSPGINDPTTAVLALDQIHHLLRNVGSRCLDDERVRDAAGQVRLVYRTPDWEDFVHLAVTEIRHFGGESIQIARRLRAMLENLIQTLPEARIPLLRQELHLLHKSAQRFFLEPEDRALADVSDFQGVGGKDWHSHADRKGEKVSSS
ncbi:MAG TPA: DUF2254 domain-containing protein [Gemmataceae bacterium]|jgi:uncharacterized membrane protein